ncbi:MAG: hypothetical protein R3D71_05060 [Rickettsiales bacterium]
MAENYIPTFAEKVKFGKSDAIMTYYGKNRQGEDFFCYIRCDFEGYRKMQEDYLNRTYATPESYGKVIYRDELPEPDAKAEKFLSDWVARNN